VAKSQMLAFVIAGEFITKQARTFWWDEGEKDRALDLLQCLQGITTDQALDVIFGRAKLNGDSNVGVRIESDNAKTSPCGNPMKGSLVETLHDDKKKMKSLEDDFKDEIGEKVFSASQYGGIELGRRALEKVKKGETTFEKLAERGLIKRIEPVLTPLRELKEKIRAIDDEQVETSPKPDKSLNARNGWVDREGRLFPCNYMEHILLGQLLGSEEQALEKRGWVKITDYQTAPIPVPPRDVAVYYSKIQPTDAQKKTVIDWCAKHKHKIPKWLTE